MRDLVKRVVLPAAVLLVCGCRKPKQETPQPEFQVVAAPSTVASPAPSDTAAAATSVVASASASAAPTSPAPTQLGLIGVINAGDAGDSNAWGRPIGDAFGTGGLGLSGLDAGGGGTIGLGTLGSLGHGAGTGTGTGPGFGSGKARFGSGRLGNPVRVRQGATTVHGRLPPEVVQRIVRRNFGRFRYCYEQGRARNPSLAGKVVVKFVVDGQGNVSSAKSDSSTAMADAAVVACVVRSFSSLVFPQPEGGIVTVVYPISFSVGSP